MTSEGLATLLGAEEGRSLGGGDGGHGPPSIDSRRLEFIRHKPGEALVSFAAEPMKSGALCLRLGRSWAAWPCPECVQGASGARRPGPAAHYWFPTKQKVPLKMAGDLSLHTGL